MNILPDELIESTELTADKDGERLDVFLARTCVNTRSFMQKLIESGDVTVNGKSTKTGFKLSAGDCVSVCYPPVEDTELVPQDIPLEIVYEDPDIAVINKPIGMVVHPAPGNPDGTLVNAIMYHIKDLSGIGGQLRPGIVHRIDKLTSGLIVIAKNDASHVSLCEQFREHSAYRSYIAIVNGNIKEEMGTVDAPIARHRTDRKRMTVADGGREAVTHWRTLLRFGEYTLLLLKLETGRTHQIRVHMAHIKHPVVGDTVYSSCRNAFGLEGQALHAVALELTHPTSGERMRFFAPVPNHIVVALRRLGVQDTDALYEQIKEVVKSNTI